MAQYPKFSDQNIGFSDPVGFGALSARVIPAVIVRQSTIPFLAHNGSIRITPITVSRRAIVGDGWSDSVTITTPLPLGYVTVTSIVVARYTFIPTPAVRAVVRVTSGVIARLSTVVSPTIRSAGNVYFTSSVVARQAVVRTPLLRTGLRIATSRLARSSWIPTPRVVGGLGAQGLLDWEFKFDTYLFGRNNPCGVFEVEGLSPPDVKDDIMAKVSADGAFVFARYSQPRYVTISGDIVTDDLNQIETLVNNWRQAFSPRTGDAPLLFKLPGVATRRINCRPSRRPYIVDFEYARGYCRWAVELIAADPAIYNEAGVKVLDA